MNYTLRTVGEFDVETVSCLYDALREIPQKRSGRTIIDVSQVGFGDSSFLEALIRTHSQKRTLILAGPLPSELRRLFQLMGALLMFRIEPHAVSYGCTSTGMRQLAPENLRNAPVRAPPLLDRAGEEHLLFVEPWAPSDLFVKSLIQVR
ncbi:MULTISPECIES: STAS domain-containing protein [unclassified Streptomyces]|uniref:STAS domain-containing protein n=1 Tax=Streptomyces sp. NPDC127129 TaxID=3345373 RepID=UPI003636AE67